MNKKRETVDEMKDRISSYWDKKTLFVHRRAFILGFFSGAMLGSFWTVIILLMAEKIIL